MRKPFLAICLMSAFISGAHAVYAQCDCIGANRVDDYRGSRYSTAYEEFENSEAVFVGEFVEMKKIERPVAFQSDSPYEYEIKFKVNKAWRENLEDVISLRLWAGCLIGFEKGKEYLVYAFVHEGVLRTNYCSRTRLLTKAAGDLKEFEEKGEKPREVIKAALPKP